jgi:hypothetical protein
MNSNFSKIFQIDEDHQVLYHLIVIDDEETGENETAIEMKTFIDGLQMVAKISGFKTKTAEEQLETITMQQAVNFFDSMNNLTK